MTKEKLLTVLVVTLAAMNLGILIFTLTNRSGPPPFGQEPFQRIIEHLRLDERQQRQFEEMRDKHHENMLRLDEKFSETLSDYFDLLKDSDGNPVLSDSLENVMATIEKEKARITLEHFQQLKLILRENQKQAFLELVPELSRVINKRNSLPPPKELKNTIVNSLERIDFENW